MEDRMTDRNTKKTDVTDELLTSLEQAVAIARGDLAPGRVHAAPSLPEVDVRAARQRLGMTQPEFARAFAVALPTLRKWEQGQRRPDGPARVLLQVIVREPDAVRRALVAAATNGDPVQ
jgi:putative transcriptional regulator